MKTATRLRKHGNWRFFFVYSENVQNTETEKFFDSRGDFFQPNNTKKNEKSGIQRFF